jgi:hypothetical protein
MAKDELAGRRVKCPKCSQVLAIPGKALAGAAAGASGSSSAGHESRSRMLDLLDDVGVKKVTLGPTCPACGAELQSTAIICVECGYNVATGEKLETEVDTDTGIVAVGVTDVDRVMAKAEESINEMPITAAEQDFGDGPDSYLIAVGALSVLAALVILGLGVVLLMDALTSEIRPAVISSVASLGVALLCAIWISIIAFRTDALQGMACVISGGLWCIPFGFMQGRATLLPAVVQLAAVLISAFSFWYMWRTGS